MPGNLAVEPVACPLTIVYIDDRQARAPISQARLAADDLRGSEVPPVTATFLQFQDFANRIIAAPTVTTPAVVAALSFVATKPERQNRRLELRHLGSDKEQNRGQLLSRPDIPEKRPRSNKGGLLGRR